LGRRGLEWGYANSPYLDFGEEHFDLVMAAFLDRDRAFAAPVEDDAWDREYELRLAAMEGAMRTLDLEGVFGTGETRDDLVVLVEVVPPDWTNTARAYRLNPKEGHRFRAWLEEAAELEPEPPPDSLPPPVGSAG
jgi:hypothetical protein